jgi:hypothetical protein
MIHSGAARYGGNQSGQFDRFSTILGNFGRKSNVALFSC